MAALLRSGVLAATALSALQGCGGDSAPQDAPARPNVLIVSLDTLRADHLGCYGYDPYSQPVSPAIDALAAEGVRFDRCFTPRGQTLPSLSTLMSGQYPSRHGIRENGHSFVGGDATLAERLSRVGYDTAAYVSILPGVSRETQSTGPARGFETFDTGNQVLAMRPGKESFRSDKNDWDRWVADQGKSYLSGRRDQDAPFFLWLHFYAIHRAYAPPAPYHTRFVGDYAGDLRPPDDAALGDRRRLDIALCESTLSGVPLSEQDRAYAVSQYDGGIRYDDDLVGEVLRTLEAQGLAEDTLVIFTSDHGEELGDHQEYWFHGNSVYDSTLRVPLIVRWPGHVPPGTVDGLCQNVDVVPSVLEMLDVSTVSGEFEGCSFAPALRDPQQRAQLRESCYFEWQDLIWAVRTERWKYLSNPLKAHPKKPPYFHGDNTGFAVADEELYDLRADPAESSSRMADPGPAPLDVLRQRLGEHRSREGQVAGWNEVESAEVLEQLRALGYVSSVPGRPDVFFREN